MIQWTPPNIKMNGWNRNSKCCIHPKSDSTEVLWWDRKRAAYIRMLAKMSWSKVSNWNIHAENNHFTLFLYLFILPDNCNQLHFNGIDPDFYFYFSQALFFDAIIVSLRCAVISLTEKEIPFHAEKSCMRTFPSYVNPAFKSIKST